MTSPAKRSVVSFLFFFLTAVCATGQDLDDITIAGRVVDMNNMSIAGAIVTATHTQSNISRTTTTKNEGIYRFIELKPGVYKVHVSAKGFAGNEITDLETVSGRQLKLDF